MFATSIFLSKISFRCSGWADSVHYASFLPQSCRVRIIFALIVTNFLNFFTNMQLILSIRRCLMIRSCASFGAFIYGKSRVSKSSLNFESWIHCGIETQCDFFSRNKIFPQPGSTYINFILSVYKKTPPSDEKEGTTQTIDHLLFSVILNGCQKLRLVSFSFVHDIVDINKVSLDVGQSILEKRESKWRANQYNIPQHILLHLSAEQKFLRNLGGLHWNSFRSIRQPVKYGITFRSNSLNARVYFSFTKRFARRKMYQSGLRILLQQAAKLLAICLSISSVSSQRLPTPFKKLWLGADRDPLMTASFCTLDLNHMFLYYDC